MKTIEEWDREGNAFNEKLAEESERADSATKMLPLVSKGLAFAAENYLVVRENRADGLGATGENATLRALQAIEDGARTFVAIELKSMAEACQAGKGHPRDPDDCDYCTAYEDAAQIILERSAEMTEGEARAREGS
jgi:hypothetical protein